MGKLRAAMLAAGRGVRMGGAAAKTLLPLGDHEPMLHYILAGLDRAGVDDLLVVTGFESGEVQNYVSEHWSHEVAFVANARYASWGNFHSVRVALDRSPGYDLMVVNSDVVVPPAVYERAAAAPGDLVLAVETRSRLDHEDMRVALTGSSIRGIGKNLPMGASAGEYCGVSLLRGTAHRVYQDIANAWEWAGQTTGYYEDVYGEMLGRVVARASVVRDGEYAEVDTPEDVRGALAVIERHAHAWS